MHMVVSVFTATRRSLVHSDTGVNVRTRASIESSKRSQRIGMSVS
jgi:hypothetical protein